MKKLICMLMVLLLVGCMSTALAEQCKYAGQGGPCDVKWWVDTTARKHCRACFYHVDDKEDMDSHVPITEWAACTLDAGGECTVCGWDYEKEPTEDDYSDIYMLEFYMVLSAELGYAPVDVTVSGSKLSIEMSDDFFEFMDAMGIPVSESMMVKTTYTLTLPQGLTYQYEGQAVTPEVKVDASEYGPGAWMMQYGLLKVGETTYKNNNAPGTATACVELTVKNGETYTLQKNFTIEGAGPYCKYGSASSPCDIHWEAENGQHASFCVNHVEDKEDMYSYVQVTDWEDCTLDANQVCTVCGANYAPKEPEDPDYNEEMLALYDKLTEKQGRAPLEVEYSKDSMTVSVSEQYLMYMLEYGIPVPANFDKATTFVFTLADGDSYDYTGEEICPEVVMNGNGVGPGAWLEQNDLIAIRDVTYEDNIQPGTGKAMIRVRVSGDGNYLLELEFAIKGEEKVNTVEIHDFYMCSPGDMRLPIYPDYSSRIGEGLTQDDFIITYESSASQVTVAADGTVYIADGVGLNTNFPLNITYTPKVAGVGVKTIFMGRLRTAEAIDQIIPEKDFYRLRLGETISPIIELNGGSTTLVASVTADGGLSVDKVSQWGLDSIRAEITAQAPGTAKLTVLAYNGTVGEIEIDVVGPPTQFKFAKEHFTCRLGEKVDLGLDTGNGPYGLAYYYNYYTRIYREGEEVPNGYLNNSTGVFNASQPGEFHIICSYGEVTGEVWVTVLPQEEPELPPIFPGDTDGDEQVTLNDAIALLDALANGGVINYDNADVNGDGQIDAKDALLILQYIAGWNVSLK